MCATSARLRLHYCHGLESGPQGYKASALRTWAEVTVPDQQMSLWDPRKRNSIARNLLRQLPRRPRTDLAVLRSLEQCALVQREAMRSPDLLIGSSWGGLVASVLLIDKIWSGPTVLLCPANWSMERRFPSLKSSCRSGNALARGIEGLPASTRRRMTVVHGTADTVVPIEDSRRLAEQAGIRLVEVDGGNHGLGSIVASGQLRSIIEEMVETRRRS